MTAMMTAMATAMANRDVHKIGKSKLKIGFSQPPPYRKIASSRYCT
jgi:hypothetical protein